MLAVDLCQSARNRRNRRNRCGVLPPNNAENNWHLLSLIKLLVGGVLKATRARLAFLSDIS